MLQAFETALMALLSFLPLIIFIFSESQDHELVIQDLLLAKRDPAYRFDHIVN